MNQAKLEDLLNGFTGDEKHDIAYFLQLSKDGYGNTEHRDIYNSLLERLKGSLTPETKELFLTELKENGLEYLIKPEKAELHSLSAEDIVMIKKVMLGQIKVKQTPITFDKAVINGKQFTVCVPKEIVERMKKERREQLEQNDESE